MDLQDKCSCVCERESSGTKRPFQSADGMEKVSIMRTSNQSKTKAWHVENTDFMQLKLHLSFSKKIFINITIRRKLIWTRLD